MFKITRNISVQTRAFLLKRITKCILSPEAEAALTGVRDIARPFPGTDIQINLQMMVRINRDSFPIIVSHNKILSGPRIRIPGAFLEASFHPITIEVVSRVVNHGFQEGFEETKMTGDAKAPFLQPYMDHSVETTLLPSNLEFRITCVNSVCLLTIVIMIKSVPTMVGAN